MNVNKIELNSIVTTTLYSRGGCGGARMLVDNIQTDVEEGMGIITGPRIKKSGERGKQVLVVSAERIVEPSCGERFYR